MQKFRAEFAGANLGGDGAGAFHFNKGAYG